MQSNGITGKCLSIKALPASSLISRVPLRLPFHPLDC